MKQQTRVWLGLTGAIVFVAGVYILAYTIGERCKDGTQRFTCERVDRQSPSRPLF